MRTKIAKNFYCDEFACRCGCGFETISMRLVKGLQILRDITQSPIHVNSGCRCKEHNSSVGGSPKSQHILGKAADIHVEGYTPEEVYDFAKFIPEFENSGIGLYDTFVHLDVRNGKSRWDLRSKK